MNRIGSRRLELSDVGDWRAVFNQLADGMPDRAATVRRNDVVAVVGPVGDYAAELAVDERAQIAQAVPKRIREFSTGRSFAKRALAELGIAASSIPGDHRRAPVWPAGVKATISHTDEVAVVVATTSSHIAGLGVDLELCDAAGPQLAKMLLTDAETQLLARIDEGPAAASWLTRTFSAKEAIYKAVNPISGLMIDFTEAELQWDAAGTEFSATYVGQNQDNAIMNLGAGSAARMDRYHVTGFVVPAETG